ncbi:Fic family protein [Corynebacterium sp. 13CS0277]|uniref:Fic family protein n=1 Tax=Corynebacterium sp. 13CS0277 TaxID=2071994 RepID=UPI001304BBB0|nr:Fic family protein [Corynebacterium sp. 13CS0277]
MTVPWPTVSTTSVSWDASVAAAPVSRRQRARTPTTVPVAVVPTIADAAVPFPTRLLPLVEEATCALVRARMSPAAAPLLLHMEARASSAIEGITASARKILEADAGLPGTRDAALIAAHTRTLRTALAAQWPPRPTTLRAMHEDLLGAESPDIAGQFRTEHVWIGGDHASPANATYVGPDAGTITALIDDLLKFLDTSQYPTLAVAALAHAQFETIHPFADGNGRTGRALIHLTIRGRGLADQGAWPISGVLLRDTRTYVSALEDYRRGNPWTIVELFCTCAIAAAEAGQWACAELATIRQRWAEHTTSRADSPDRAVLDLLLSHPIITRPQLHDAFTSRHSPAALDRSMVRLVNSGIVVASKPARGLTAWRAVDVLDLLDEFATTGGPPRHAHPIGGTSAAQAFPGIPHPQ